MKKLRLSARRLSWVSLTSLLLGIVTFAFSQLATNPEIPPGDASAQVASIRQGLEVLEARMADVRSAQARLRRRAETDRLARDLEQASKGVSGLDATVVPSLTDQLAKLDEELARTEAELDLRQGETARTLSGVEGRLQESKEIFEDAMENSGGNSEEVLPILRVVAQNLGHIENELQAVVQLVGVGEKEGGRAVGALAQKVSGVLDEVAKVRVAGEGAKAAAEAAAAKAAAEAAAASASAGSRGVSDAVRSIKGGSTTPRFDPGIRSEGGDVGVARQAADERNLSEATVEKLRSELAASRNVQVALSEDTEKLQSDLRRAYREIVSLQSGLKESEHLVKELEESRMALLRARGQDATGVEAVSRMVSRLEGELKTARDELRLARQSLLSEQDRSNTMIRTLSNELGRTRRELDSARVAAASTGADAGRLLALEQELERTKNALLAAKAIQVEGDPEVSDKLRDELRKALVEITRLQAELNGKDELDAQMTTMRETIKRMSDSPSRAVSAEYVNQLLLELNAAKLAVNEAKAESENLRVQLSGRIKALDGNIGQSQVDLDNSRLDLENAREAMARKEFEFASTIKDLEDELQETQVALQEATQGAIRKVPVVGNMERTLADSQTRIDSLSRRFDEEQAKAGELVSALQVELETTKRRHESTLQELAEKEKQLKGREHELQRNREDAAALKTELGEVETIANQLQQLNDVLDETKKTQNSQVSDADRIISSLREQLNENQVELVFAKEAKEKVEERSASQIVALEHQLEQTREQLAATQSNMYDRTAGSKELIQDLKVELDGARKEIARLKTMGAGDSVGAQQAVAQLQEALGTIRVLQESLDQSEQVNAEVDGLRTELANAMQSQLGELERSDLEKDRLHKKIADLEVEVKVLSEDGAGRNVNYAKAMARLSEQLQSSQNRVTQLEVRMAQSEDSGVGTITALEEQLEVARNRSNELEAQMQQALQGKGHTLELLERELALSNQQLDELEARQSSGAPETAKLERRLVSAKLQLDEMAKQRNETDDRTELAEQLREQLIAAEAKITGLETVLSEPEQAAAVGKLTEFSRLEKDLADAQNTISDLQTAVEAKELQRSEMEEQLAGTIRDMAAFQKAGQDTVAMRKQLEDLRAQIALASSRPSPSTAPAPNARLVELRGEIESLKAELELARELAARPDPNDPSAPVPALDARLAELRGEIESLKAELELARELAARPNPTVPSAPVSLPDVRLAELRGEVESLKAELELARELAARPGQADPDAAKLKTKLADKVGEVMELTTQLGQANQRLQDLQDDPSVPMPSAELDALNKSLTVALAQLEASDAARAADEKKLEELTATVDSSKGLQDDLLQLQKDLAAAKAESSLPVVDPKVEELKTELDQTKEALRRSEAQVAQLKGLGNDLVLLQKDLLVAKTEASTPVSDPTASGLQTELLQAKEALRKSEADVLRLNDEFRRSMQDFGLLKGQLVALQAENASLQMAANALPIASNPLSDQFVKNDRDRLVRENSVLRTQLQERESRVSNLRESMANMAVPGGAPNESEVRARLLQAENQLDTARSAEQRAKLDFQRSDAELKEANRRLILIEEDLRSARSRVAELEAVQGGLAPSVLASRPSSPIGTSASSAVVSQLQAENDRLKRELTVAQSGQGQGVVGREVQELRQKQLISNMQLEREQVKIADLQRQLQEAKQVKRENFERDRAQRQRITLQDEELKVARNRVTELEGAVVSMREAIRVLRGGGSGDTRIRSLVSSPTSTGSSTPTPRSYPSPSSGRGVGGGFASTPRVSSFPPRMEPLPLPGRPGRSARAVGTPSGVLPGRPSVPVVRSVPRGEGTLELTASVQFLNNKVRPAGDIEFFVVSEAFDTIVKRAGINIPVEQGIKSSAELWARSVQSGYRYPGVAAHIRNALADANLARIKTDARGLASVGSLAAGTYHLVGTAPLGRVGVVWSKSFNIDPGRTNKLSLDLRDASWAQ